MTLVAVLDSLLECIASNAGLHVNLTITHRLLEVDEPQLTYRTVLQIFKFERRHELARQITVDVARDDANEHLVNVSTPVGHAHKQNKLVDLRG